MLPRTCRPWVIGLGFLVIAALAGAEACASQLLSAPLGAMAASMLPVSGVAALSRTIVDPGTEVYYFYLVIGCDGVVSGIQEMTVDEANTLAKRQKDEYKQAAKEWLDLKAKWVKAYGSKPFPVLLPKKPEVERHGTVPTSSDKARDRAMENLRKELEVYDVCTTKNSKGEHSFEALRHDKVYSRLVELQKEYVEAAMAWTEAHKGEEKPDTKDAPVVPGISTYKGGIRSAELADKYVEKLKKDAEKKEAEKEKPVAPDKPPAKDNPPPDKAKEPVKEAL